MGHLEHIAGPQDLRTLDDRELSELASEIRDELVRTCSPRGGHLGPNLGVVELTMAIHRVFDSPRDRVVFDTGHQAYVHKMLTGRAPRFDSLRSEGGLSGYPSQAESDHDVVENSHASTSLSYADGLAKAYAIRGEDRHVVAVIGDGALTGGMAWEALNNIAEGPLNRGGDRRLVMIVNDNGRSYMPTVGGLANHLTTLRTSPRYEQILDVVKRRLNGVRGVGPAVYDALHAMKKGMKDALAPQGLFEDLGLKYVGPIDGHDRSAVEHALTQAKKLRWPGDRARDDPQGLRLRPRGAARGRPVPPDRPLRRRDRCGHPQGPDLDRLLLRGDPRPRCRAPGPRRDHGGDALPGGARPVRRGVPRAHLRRRHRRAARRRPAQPGSRWVACTRSSPSTPPSSTVPSTRC